MSNFAAIVLSAGRGSRMKSDIPKQYMYLNGKPVIYYSLKAFEDAGFNLTVSAHKEKIYMEPESELVKKLISVYTDYTGEKAVPKSIGGGTYAKMMKNVLAFGPIFPGDEVREHKPDEFMEISRLLDNAAIFANAMYELAKD